MPSRPRCDCGSLLRFDLGPGLHHEIVVSAYCPRCDMLTMPWDGPLPPDVQGPLEQLLGRRRGA